jgi:hypothetical protein
LKLSEMTFDPQRFDSTRLEEGEEQFVLAILQALSAQLTSIAMGQGVIAAVQAGAGAVARMVKANLEGGIQVASLEDVNQLVLPGMDRNG